MATEFYTGKSDANLKKDAILKSGALMIQRVIMEVSAEFEDTGTTLELPSTSVFVDDEYNSAGDNLEVIDDDGDICSTKITDTVFTTKLISFVEADLKKVKNGLAAVLTDAKVYAIRILTPTLATDLFAGAYGKYFGFATAIGFEPINEKAQLKIDVPKTLVLEGDLENGYSLTGTVSNPANADIMKTIFGMDEFGPQTGQYSLAWGSNNAARDFFRLFVVSQDEAGRDNVNRFLLGRFGINGSMDFISDEFKSVGWKFSGFADGMYPENANMFMRIRKD